MFSNLGFDCRSKGLAGSLQQLPEQNQSCPFHPQSCLLLCSPRSDQVTSWRVLQPTSSHYTPVLQTLGLCGHLSSFLGPLFQELLGVLASFGPCTCSSPCPLVCSLCPLFIPLLYLRFSALDTSFSDCLFQCDPHFCYVPSPL